MKDCLKYTIINSKSLDLQCFSPKYYLNLCSGCEKQKECKIVKEEKADSIFLGIFAGKEVKR
jgi:hypothetical protein